MKHIFIVNPHAGPHSCEAYIRASIKPYQDAFDIEVYVKQHVGDSREAIRDYRVKYPDEELRFYACGGDGTLREVAIACQGVDRVAFTAFSCGTGNDYVKYYGGADAFRDIRRLLEGEAVPIDMMHVLSNEANATDKNYDGDVNSKTAWAMNATHFGLDACVAKTMHTLRRVPLIGKKMAYPTSVLWGALTGMRTKCTVWADGEKLNNGQLLLCTACNGTHVGGSYNAAPRSDNGDGLMEVCLVLPTSAIRFLFLKKIYKNGQHLDHPRCKNIIIYRRAKTLTIDGDPGLYISLDGEIFRGSHIEVTNVQHAVQFIIPKKE